MTEATYRGRRVAAKCIHEEGVSPHDHEAFVKGIKILARCRHQNLVEFIGAVPDYPAIILLELMDAILREALASGTVTPNHIHPISMDVAQALVYLHSIQPHPLIHHAVNAGNVLLKSSRNILALQSLPNLQMNQPQMFSFMLLLKYSMHRKRQLTSRQ